MLDPGDLQQLVRTARGAPLVGHEATSVELGPDALQRLLPHRPPMLLVDGIDGVDLAGSSVRGYRRLRHGDLGFAGHFPDEPIYPGVLVVEAMGQLALTLLHFVRERRVDVPESVVPGRMRATQIHHARFVAPFRPGDVMSLQARVAHDDYTLIAICQAWNGDALAACAIAEVLVDE